MGKDKNIVHAEITKTYRLWVKCPNCGDTTNDICEARDKPDAMLPCPHCKKGHVMSGGVFADNVMDVIGKYENKRLAVETCCDCIRCPLTGKWQKSMHSDEETPCTTCEHNRDNSCAKLAETWADEDGDDEDDDFCDEDEEDDDDFEEDEEDEEDEEEGVTKFTIEEMKQHQIQEPLRSEVGASTMYELWKKHVASSKEGRVDENMIDHIELRIVGLPNGMSRMHFGHIFKEGTTFLDHAAYHFGITKEEAIATVEKIAQEKGLKPPPNWHKKK